MKEHTQSTRYTVFKILDSLVAKNRSSGYICLGFSVSANKVPALQGMGDEFLEGYISIVDGEKDPRNLMLAFAIDRVLCIEFDISNHVEVSAKFLRCDVRLIERQDMFNIIFCYFPITFRPPKDDPYGITSEDLRLALQYVTWIHGGRMIS